MESAHLYTFIGGAPFWEWVGTAMIIAPMFLLFAVIGYEAFLRKPLRRVQVGDVTFELWVSERKMPGGADAIIVPVAPDLKMSAGIAKWVRDATANSVQYEAAKVAPLPPGDTFIGSGGRYKFKTTALAVVMDDAKRTRTEWIVGSIGLALNRLRREDANSVLLPDFTEDLLRQPTWISDEQRRETCTPIARAMIDGVLQSGADMEIVKIWAWRGNKDIWIAEMDRVAVDVRKAMIKPVAV